MTTNQSCYTRIIGHKSLTVHQICTKCDTKIRLWTPFLCAKFQSDRSMRLHFIAIYVSVQKDKEKKNEEKKTKHLAACIL